MSSTLRGTLLVTAAVAVVLLVAETASATPSVAFNGTFTNGSSVLTSFRQADGNTFISQTVSVVYAGDFAGPVTEQIDLVIHPDGSINFKGADVCTCTIAGRSGTIVLPFSGTGDSSGFLSGRFTVGHGTGELSNLHGVGMFQSSNGGAAGPFSGTYHFDP
jgi:Protein of unknown function (DUF3224)